MLHSADDAPAPLLQACEFASAAAGGGAATVAQRIELDGDWDLSRGERAGLGLAIAAVASIVVVCCCIFCCSRCSLCLTAKTDTGLPKEAAAYKKGVRNQPFPASASSEARYICACWSMLLALRRPRSVHSNERLLSP